MASVHRNMVSERSEPIPIVKLGHPLKQYTPGLVNVPWHGFSSGDRTFTSAIDPTERVKRVSVEVDSERLGDL
jgi:hypothetical protein